MSGSVDSCGWIRVVLSKIEVVAGLEPVLFTTMRLSGQESRFVRTSWGPPRRQYGRAKECRASAFQWTGHPASRLDSLRHRASAPWESASGCRPVLRPASRRWRRASPGANATGIGRRATPLFKSMSWVKGTRPGAPFSTSNFSMEARELNDLEILRSPRGFDQTLQRHILYDEVIRIGAVVDVLLAFVGVNGGDFEGLRLKTHGNEQDCQFHCAYRNPSSDRANQSGCDVGRPRAGPDDRIARRHFAHVVFVTGTDHAEPPPAFRVGDRPEHDGSSGVQKPVSRRRGHAWRRLPLVSCHRRRCCGRDQAKESKPFVKEYP